MKKRVLVGLVVVVAAAGGFAAYNWTALNARYAAHRFRAAATPEDRAPWAAKLVALGDAGAPYLAEPFRAGDADGCAAVVAAVRGNPAACGALLDGFGSFTEAGKVAALDVVPELLGTADGAARCRAAVRDGLALPAARVRAVRLAARPEVALKADVAPLLNDPAAEVRRAAMLAVGPFDGNAPAVGDEDLFKWLHDPDPEVRDLCESALHSRGLDAVQVHLARQLSHPSAAKRLVLLTDLTRFGDAVKEPGPWLERLSRDADPAVRVGAARVAVERRLMFTGWLDRMADGDADPTVRRLAAYYRGQAEAVRQTGFTGR